METMEEYKVVRIVNEEPEFCEGQRSNAIVDYFIICEESKRLYGQCVYDLEVCGMNFVNWVARACESKPRVIKVYGDEDVLDVIRPYVNRESDYSVVLFADTPLVNKAHLLDLIEFIDRKRMNICKLKRGFVFRNDYIEYNDEFYCVDEYDFASDDFLVVENNETFDEVKNKLSKKVIEFHKRNGILFENENTVTIDANAQIGEFTKISSGVSVVKGSKIASNCVIGNNVKISSSIVGENVKVRDNSLIYDSIIKNNVCIDMETLIKDSIVGNNSLIELGASVRSSSLKDGVILKSSVLVDNGRIAESVVINKYSNVIGIKDRVIIGANCEIGEDCRIVDSKIADNSIIEMNSKVYYRVDE